MEGVLKSRFLICHKFSLKIQSDDHIQLDKLDSSIRHLHLRKGVSSLGDEGPEFLAVASE